MKSLGRKQRLKSIALTGICATVSAANVFAADAPQSSGSGNSVATLLIIVAGVLMLAIGMLGYVLTGVANFYAGRLKETATASASAVKTVVMAGLCLITSVAFAGGGVMGEKTTQEVVTTTIGGMSKGAFYLLTGVIALEAIILLGMLYFVQLLVAKEKVQVVAEVQAIKKPYWRKLWTSINSFRPMQEEKTLALDHDYDGIVELDNNLPPWWLYGFYACILFSGIYLYRAHISHAAPSPLQEYQVAVAEAEEAKEEYLKSAANKVDENTVTLLTDASALGEGKQLYASSCSPCHGANAQGVVGPNLTDDYWLHKGSVKDVFKTIKYGVPEKGMKSWKDDFSPVQLAAITSYIKSLRGSKPANAKEPQGELFKDAATAAATANSTNALNKKLAIR
jgi:cytochrome c oxidase cbb3-type subunit 3